MSRAAQNPLAAARFLPAGEALEPLPHAGERLPAFYECEICGALHPNGFYGDCRDDLNRLSEEDLAARYGRDGFAILEMEEAD